MLQQQGMCIGRQQSKNEKKNKKLTNKKVAKSEHRPPPNGDAMKQLEESHTHNMSKEYDRAKAVLSDRMGLNFNKQLQKSPYYTYTILTD